MEERKNRRAAAAVATRSVDARFRRFKARLSGGLPQDFAEVRTPSVGGLVSVVMPVYNGAEYVGEAMESALGQSRGELELIVVDDGSTDGTPREIERRRSDGRVRLIRTPNRGLPAALNAGFAVARGEYFTWISADNRMKPEMLARMVEYLEVNRDVEMVYADHEMIDARGRRAENRPTWGPYQKPPGSGMVFFPQDTGELNYRHNNYIGSCFLYRAWAARLCGKFDEACFGYEDYDYWMRMNALFRVQHRGVEEVLNQYRVHAASLSAREKELRIAERSRRNVEGDRKRRAFYLEPFDITLAGRHEWFAELAAAYRRAGHNVFEARTGTAEEVYRYEVSRAHRKAVLITSGTEPGRWARTGQEFYHAALVGNRVLLGERELGARAAGGIAYPLLAGANASLWVRRGRGEKGPEVGEVAVAEVGRG